MVHQLLIDDLASWIIKQVNRFGRVKLIDYGICVVYSYALVEGASDEFLGVALTPIEDLMGVKLEPAPEVRGFNDAVRLVSSINPLSKSLGVALLNALSSYLVWGEGVVGDAVIREGEDILEAVPELVKPPALIVGNMAPLVKALSEFGVNEVNVVERCASLRCGRALSDAAFYRLAGNASTIIATGATLVNDTIDYIIKFKRPDSTLILVGPTAGSHPHPLLKFGADAVASMRFASVSKALNVIKRGGGRWSFTKYCIQYVATPK